MQEPRHVETRERLNPRRGFSWEEDAREDYAGIRSDIAPAVQVCLLALWAQSHDPRECAIGDLRLGIELDPDLKVEVERHVRGAEGSAPCDELRHVMVGRHPVAPLIGHLERRQQEHVRDTERTERDQHQQPNVAMELSHPISPSAFNI